MPTPAWIAQWITIADDGKVIPRRRVMCNPALWRSSGHPRMSGRYIKAVARRARRGRARKSSRRRRRPDPLLRRAPGQKRSNVREKDAHSWHSTLHYQRTVWQRPPSNTKGGKKNAVTRGLAFGKRRFSIASRIFIHLKNDFR